MQQVGPGLNSVGCAHAVASASRRAAEQQDAGQSRCCSSRCGLLLLLLQTVVMVLLLLLLLQRSHEDISCVTEAKAGQRPTRDFTGRRRHACMPLLRVLFKSQ